MTFLLATGSATPRLGYTGWDHDRIPAVQKLTLSIVFLAFLLLFGCAESGQPGPSYPAPGASQPDRPGNGGTNGGMM